MLAKIKFKWKRGRGFLGKGSFAEADAKTGRHTKSRDNRRTENMKSIRSKQMLTYQPCTTTDSTRCTERGVMCNFRHGAVVMTGAGVHQATYLGGTAPARAALRLRYQSRADNVDNSASDATCLRLQNTAEVTHLCSVTPTVLEGFATALGAHTVHSSSPFPCIDAP